LGRANTFFLLNQTQNAMSNTDMCCQTDFNQLSVICWTFLFSHADSLHKSTPVWSGVRGHAYIPQTAHWQQEVAQQVALANVQISDRDGQ